MKTCFSTLIMLGALAGTVVAAPYYAAEPAGGALTPYDPQPVYTLETLYSSGQHRQDPDLWGMRGNFSFYSSGDAEIRHEGLLSVASQWGTLRGEAHKSDCFYLPATVGYNLNMEVTDDVLLYMGGKGGYAWLNTQPGHSAGGATWSVGAGLKFQCTQSTYVQVGYEYGRTHFSHGDLRGNMGEHTFSFGVGCTF